MANRIWAKLIGSLTPGLGFLTGRVVLGAAGAIASQSCNGFSVAHGGAGLYTVTLDDTFSRVEKCTVTLFDGAALTAAKANTFYCPAAGNTIENATPGKTFTFQGVRSDTLANAVPADSAQLRIELTLKNSGRTF